MGAVQSGKTASMMAVTALSLDQQVDAVVILAGTRRSLWLQTLERFIAQVDALPHRLKRRTLLPNPGVLGSDQDLPSPAGLYSLTRPGARSMLKAKRPLVVVAMKNPAHLEQVGRLMRTTIAPEVLALGRPFHLLVIDDEADDSSIDNVVQVPGADEATLDVKQVPRRILDLWEPRHGSPGTFNQHFHATYMAYTATPQANFLQDAGNPLAPRDFIVGLRSPGETGSIEPRSSSYRVPEGLAGWYTGGDVYYRALSNVPLCVPNGARDDDLIDSVRAHLVAAAIRRLRKPGRLAPAAARGAEFRTKAEALEQLPPITSMLVNPSAALGDHFEVAGQIYDWAAGHAQGQPHAPFESLSDRWLRADGVAQDMDSQSDRWLHWLESYQRSAVMVPSQMGGPPRPVPSVDEWDDLRSVILGEIVPGTSVAVINSDLNADERPEFAPVARSAGWVAPANLSTIFVSGNVMSRGLTLEGLVTTVFTRAASNPLADTQMQMQRWFGYRGSYIDLCRVFMREEQIELFTHYHENDELLRGDILAAMDGAELPSPAILQGRNFVATGKFSNVSGISLAPGHRPFFGHMNGPADDVANRELLGRLLTEPHVIVGDRDDPRGVLLDRQLSLEESAGLLDELVYANHGSDPDGFLVSRWRSAETAANLTEGDAATPLYRAPEVSDGFVDLHSSPYSVAAYLRFWAACLNRSVPGLYTTDVRPRPWRLLDATARSIRRPSFSVGVRFGSGPPVSDGPLASSPFRVRPMQRTIRDMHRIDGIWGSQNGPTRGDDFFDYEARGLEPKATDDRTRPPGEDGMILFHLVHREGQSPTVAVAYAIPRGGPDFVQATRGVRHDDA